MGPKSGQNGSLEKPDEIYTNISTTTGSKVGTRAQPRPGSAREYVARILVFKALRYRSRGGYG